MSCTDDKTACPCEPEKRMFQAADLKQAILTNNGADEPADPYDDDNETWYKLEVGVPVPNEVFDQEAYDESQRLYEVWRVSTRNGGWNGDSPEYAAYTTHREQYGNKLQSTRQVPWVFEWNGKDLPVTVVEDNGGTEGGGEAVHMVYKVCNRLFRLDGSYYSYDGTTWDDDSFREVKAVTKAVVFYE